MEGKGLWGKHTKKAHFKKNIGIYLMYEGLDAVDLTTVWLRPVHDCHATPFCPVPERKLKKAGNPSDRVVLGQVWSFRARKPSQQEPHCDGFLRSNRSRRRPATAVRRLFPVPETQIENLNSVVGDHFDQFSRRQTSLPPPSVKEWVGKVCQLSTLVPWVWPKRARAWAAWRSVTEVAGTGWGEDCF